MRENYKDDAPLFKDFPINHDSSKSNGLDLQLYREKAEQARKNRMLEFGTKLSIVIICTLILLITIDIFVQIYEFDNSLIKECFNVIKYSLTTVLGYLFASKKSE